MCVCKGELYWSFVWSESWEVGFRIRYPGVGGGGATGVYDNEQRAEGDRVGGRMGLHAEGHHEAKESPGRSAGTAVQLRGIHAALHVSSLIINQLCTLSTSIVMLC